MIRAIGFFFIFLFTSAHCQTTCDNIVCPQQYSPVCASNGMTYGNFCELYKAMCMDSTLTFVSEGACSGGCDRACPMTYDPVCGSDGITYNNDCLFGVAACLDPTLSIDYRGNCWTDMALMSQTDFI